MAKKSESLDSLRGITLCVRVLLELDLGARRGQSLTQVLSRWTSESEVFDRWLRGVVSRRGAVEPPSSQCRALEELIQRGLEGLPIGQNARGLIEALNSLWESEFEIRLARQRVASTGPLFLCFVPGYLCILLGPVLKVFVGSLS